MYTKFIFKYMGRRRKSEHRTVGLFPLIIQSTTSSEETEIVEKKNQIKKEGKTSKLVNSIKQTQVLKQLLKKLKKQVLYLNLKDSNYYQKEKGEERKLVLMGQIRKKKIL